MLKITFKGRAKTPQHAYLINLSAAGIFKNVGRVSSLWSSYASVKGVLISISPPVSLFLLLSHLIYLGGMFLITIDRLLLAVMPFRYRTAYTTRKSKRVIIASWVLGIILSSAIITLTLVLKQLHLPAFAIRKVVYSILILDGMFVVFAIGTYLTIFIAYARSQRRVNQSAYGALRRSRFLLSIMLVTSYTVLTLLPNFYWVLSTLHWRGFTYEKPERKVLYLFKIPKLLSDSVDALIYVFFYPPVQTFLKRKISSISESACSKMSVFMENRRKEGRTTYTKPEQGRPKKAIVQEMNRIEIVEPDKGVSKEILVQEMNDVEIVEPDNGKQIETTVQEMNEVESVGSDNGRPIESIVQEMNNVEIVEPDIGRPIETIVQEMNEVEIVEPDNVRPIETIVQEINRVEIVGPDNKRPTETIVKEKIRLEIVEPDDGRPIESIVQEMNEVEIVGPYNG